MQTDGETKRRGKLKAEQPTGGSHPGKLAERGAGGSGSRQVLEDDARVDRIKGLVGEGEWLRTVGADQVEVGHVGIQLASAREHRLGYVESDTPVEARRELPRRTAEPTAKVQGLTVSAWQSELGCGRETLGHFPLASGEKLVLFPAVVLSVGV